MYNTTFIENISQISHMEKLIENLEFLNGPKNLLKTFKSPFPLSKRKKSIGLWGA
jgi:hypothetical protein